PAPGPYPARAPLAYPPSVFSAANIAADIDYLSGLPGGRGPGSPGAARAARHIAGIFAAAGLKPFEGADFRTKAGVLGVLKGASKSAETLVLCAHYDGLPQADGAVFPGADDNASGVALLLELARYYGARRPERAIVFAAFDGEERGRLGSKAFLAALPEPQRASVNAALNFDTVGRLGAGKVLVLGSSSSDKWVHIFRGAGFVTGTEYDLVKEDLDSSDQASFIEAGIPAVQFFSGPHADYHKPSDTADRTDARGIVKLAEFAREAIDYLAGESQPLTRPPGRAPAATGPRQERRAATGLVPDFGFQGEGVRAQDITPGSPLAAAGLKPGDVVTGIDGEGTPDLRTYSEALKKFSPGQKVRVAYVSDGAQKTAEIELAAR
ncbi:MAG: M20/M25/M40 family metallo-hydrolase, partial [Elusimicrobiales bacterium]|nr:M20/M25/M40 family metallo-hydrolase [Elusimicrobiales bacterium]